MELDAFGGGFEATSAKKHRPGFQWIEAGLITVVFYEWIMVVLFCLDVIGQ